MRISKNIANLRHKHELEKEEFCTMLGINRRTLERWENGDRIPALKYVRMMVDKFYITDIYEFMFGRRYNYERRLTKIKKVLPIIILMASCTQRDPKLPIYDNRVIVIDSCQYLESKGNMGSSTVYSLTHKGNCFNPIHTKLLK